jgi:ketosteroid isomerase-like protein
MDDDLMRIDELHRADMEASRAGDYRTLRSLMSDDAVVLPPGGHMLRGREALDESFARMTQATPTTEVLEYRFDWYEVEVCGGYAFEWGYIIGRERNLSTGEVSSERYQVMRILQRQPDDAWKVHRTIWNTPAS